MSSLKIQTSRRALLRSIGLGGMAMCGMPLKAHSQITPLDLSETQYREINEIIKGARETYSILCLTDGQNLDEIEYKFLSLQAKIDSIITLQAENILSLSDDIPWTLSNFSPLQQSEFNFIGEQQLIASKDEIFKSFYYLTFYSAMNNDTSTLAAMNETPERTIDIPDFTGVNSDRNVFLASMADEDTLNSCFDSLMIVLAQIFNINDDYWQEFIKIFTTNNSKIYLEGMVKSVIGFDYNKLKTFTELFFDEFDKNPALYDFLQSATSPVAVAILEWIAKRCVPILGLSLALLEILLALIRHRERISLCYLTIE